VKERLPAARWNNVAARRGSHPPPIACRWIARF
jgi:hypothetical protein